MFFEYEPSEDLVPAFSQAEILHAQILREKRELHLTVAFKEYVSPDLLSKLKMDLQELYGLRCVEILAKFPAEEFSKMDGRELSRMMARDYSPCSAILAGCKWEFGEETTLSLVVCGIIPVAT